MVRVVVDLAVDTEDADAVEAHVDEFLAHLREHWGTHVARRDVVGAPSPYQAAQCMVEGYRGG